MMKDDIVSEYLKEQLEELKDNSEGAVADYIPELAHADPEPLSVAFCTVDGQVYACLLYTSPSPRDVEESRMPSSA